MHTDYCVDQLVIMDNDLYKTQSYRRCFKFKKKKKKDKLHAMLIYSVTKRDPYNLFSLKITFQVVFIPTS